MSCAPEHRGFREELREHTYPRSFHYLERAELRGAMAHLAVQVYELDQALAAQPAPNREWALKSLRGMREQLLPLKRGGWPTNHPGFGANAQQLLSEVERALRHLERESPSYFWATTISAACLRCHGYVHPQISSSGN